MKQYPTDERGQLDAGPMVFPKPCAARIEHANPEPGTTWCTLRDGHDGQHSGPAPRELAPNLFDKGRRRG